MQVFGINEGFGLISGLVWVMNVGLRAYLPAGLRRPKPFFVSRSLGEGSGDGSQEGKIKTSDWVALQIV